MSSGDKQYSVLSNDLVTTVVHKTKTTLLSYCTVYTVSIASLREKSVHVFAALRQSLIPLNFPWHCKLAQRQLLQQTKTKHTHTFLAHDDDHRLLYSTTLSILSLRHLSSASLPFSILPSPFCFFAPTVESSVASANPFASLPNSSYHEFDHQTCRQCCCKTCDIDRYAAILLSPSRPSLIKGVARGRVFASLTTSTYTPTLILNTRNLSSHSQALAILLPRRGYATETSTHGGDAGGPPPGFNINEAKKPLPKEQSDKAAHSTSPSVLKDSDVRLKTQKSVATAVDKTKAREDASVTELAADKAAAENKDEEKKLAAKKEDSKKLTMGQKIKKELLHYWDGTKLLATEVKISSRLALKMAAGYELSRRESRQVLTPDNELLGVLAD